MLTRIVLKTLCLALVMTTSPGCIALAIGAAGGAAGITYAKGDLKDRLEAPVAEVYSAAVLALEEEGLPIYENEVRSSSAKLRSEYPDDKKVRIDITAISAASSKITIRVGATGNHIRSIGLLDSIKAKL